MSRINHGPLTFQCPMVELHATNFRSSRLSDYSQLLNMKNPIRILIVLRIEVAAFKKMSVQCFYHCAVQ